MRRIWCYRVTTDGSSIKREREREKETCGLDSITSGANMISLVSDGAMSEKSMDLALSFRFH